MSSLILPLFLAPSVPLSVLLVQIFVVFLLVFFSFPVPALSPVLLIYPFPILPHILLSPSLQILIAKFVKTKKAIISFNKSAYRHMLECLTTRIIKIEYNLIHK